MKRYTEVHLGIFQHRITADARTAQYQADSKNPDKGKEANIQNGCL